LLYLCLLFVSTTSRVRGWVQSAVSSITGHEATIEAIRIGYDLSLTAQTVTLANAGEPPFLTVDRLRVDWLSASLFAGRVGSVGVEGPRLFVDRLPRANGGTGNASVPIGRIDIHDGFVEYSVDERVVALGPFDLSVDSIRAGANLDLHGRSEIARGGGEVDWAVQVSPDFDTVSGQARFRIDELRSIMAAFGEIQLPDPAGDTSAALTVTFDGSLGGTVKVQADATLRHPALLEPVAVTGGGSVTSRMQTTALRLQMKLHPDLPAIRLSGRMARGGEEGPIIDAEMEWDAVEIEGLTPLLAIPLESLGGRLSLQATARGALAEPTVRGTLIVDEAKLGASSWNATGNLSAPFRLDGATLRTNGSGLRLTKWTGNVASFDWMMDDATITASVGAPGGEMTLSTTKMDVAGLQFHDDEYLRAGEGVALRGAVQATFDATGSPRLKVDVAATAGELLWNRFYVKLAPYAPRLRGMIGVSSRRVTLGGLELSLARIGKATVDGRYDRVNAARSLQADIEISELAALYEVAVRDVLRETYPLLERTTVKGKAAVAIDYREDKAGRRLSGNVELENLDVAALHPSVEVHGLSLVLPLEIGEGLPPAESRTGLLRIAVMRIGGVEAADVAIPLTVRPNQLSITNSVRIPLLGGALFLADFSADRLAGPEPRARFGLQLQEIDLGKLSVALGGPVLRGTLTGAIPKVTIASEEIRSEGEIRAGLFGGEARVRNLRVSQLFSPVPALELDVDFEELSLGQMTETLEMGHVSGVVRGSVEKLEIVGRQPVRFDAWMETVSRPGVPQRVSVAAIRQLSILGGSGGDPLSHGILSFFDEYRYAKMGFRCNLRNDRFTLRGVEEFDGKDYLIVGSVMPPRVNVISHNQTISFSQMIRRLERAMATTNEGLPTQE
jgi:hypothetical protein